MSLQPRNTGRTTGRVTGRLTGRLNPNSYSPFPVPLKSSNPANHVGLPHDPQANLNPTPVTRLDRARRAVRLNTLSGQFNALAALSVILALITMTTAFTRMGDNADNFRQIIANSAPSIVAADDLGRQLNDLDTHAADLFITSYVAANNTISQSQLGETPKKASDSFNAARMAFNSTLLKAYANVTYPGEAPTVRAVSDSFDRYLAEIGTMQSEINNKHFEAALAAYKRAHDFVIGNPSHVALPTSVNNGRTSEELLKQNNWNDDNFDVRASYQGLEANVHRLYQINHNQLKTYADKAKAVLGLNQFMIIVAALLLIAALVALAVRYALITHRVVNVGYGIALIGSVVMLIVLIGALGTANDDFQTVASDSFSSIDAISKAQQILLDFNGDESRMLMNPTLLKLNANDPALTPEVKQAFNIDLYKTNFNYKKPQILVLLNDAWANVTYPDERTALCGAYDNINTHSRPLQNTRCGGNYFPLQTYFNQHDQILAAADRSDPSSLATALTLSYGPSNDTAAKTAANLGKVVETNAKEFDRAACNSVGESQFNHFCASLKTKTGLTVEEEGVVQNTNKVNGYLDFLQSLSLVVFLMLALATGVGAWLARRIF